jgi:hypothetical protein
MFLSLKQKAGGIAWQSKETGMDDESNIIKFHLPDRIWCRLQCNWIYVKQLGLCAGCDYGAMNNIRGISIDQNLAIGTTQKIQCD